MEIKEQKVSGGTVQNIGIQHISTDTASFRKYISSILLKGGYTKKGLYYYRSGLTPFYGRDGELHKLNLFLAQPETLLIVTVTGSGGIGKSRLVYEFLNKTQNWDKAYLEWKEFRNTSMNHFIHSFEYKKDLILVLDYVLAYAEEIGDWLYHVENHLSTLTHKLRIIVIERESATSALSPYWFSRLIEKNRLENLLYAEIELHPLEKEHLIQIARYVIAKENCKQIIHDEEILENIIEPLETMDVKERPIFLLYITHAWLKYKDIKRWDLHELLKWINGNELRRIYDLFDQNTDIAEPILQLLCYATMVSGVDRDHIPDFFTEGILTIASYAKAKKTNLIHLFNEINIETYQEIRLEALIPDLLGEFFCLTYLTEQKLYNGDTEFILRLAESAIEHSENEYAAFIVRLSQDFADMELTELVCLLCAYRTVNVNAAAYGRFLHTLAANIYNPNFQIALERIFLENTGIRDNNYWNACAENLVYLIIFPFEFPGISDKKEPYLSRLCTLRDQNPVFWPQYAKAVSYLVEGNQSGTNQRQYVEEIREYLRKYTDQDTAYYFCKILIYLFKSEHDDSFLHELQGTLKCYLYSENINCLFAGFIRKELRNWNSWWNAEFFLRESFDLIAALAHIHFTVNSIRDLCIDLIYRMNHSDLPPHTIYYVCRTFDREFRMYSDKPEITHAFCVVLHRLLTFSSHPKRKERYLQRMRDLLLDVNEKNSRIENSGLDEYLRSLEEYCLDIPSENKRKALLCSVFAYAWDRPSQISDKVLEKVSELLKTSPFPRTKYHLKWQTQIQKKIFSRLPSCSMNYTVTAVLYYDFLPLKEKEQCLQTLLYSLNEADALDLEHFEEIFRSLMSHYVPQKNFSIRTQEIPAVSLDSIFLQSWSLLRCGIETMIVTSHRLLKRHFSHFMLSRYQQWIQNEMQMISEDIIIFHNIDDLRKLSEEQRRLFHRYGGHRNALFYAKGLLLCTIAVSHWKEKRKYLEKFDQISMCTTSQMIGGLYRKTLEEVIKAAHGKIRWRYLARYRKLILQRPTNFSEETYLLLMERLMESYHARWQSPYLNEIAECAEDLASLQSETAYITLARLISRKINSVQLCIRFCKRLLSAAPYNELVQNAVSCIIERPSYETFAESKLLFLFSFVEDILEVCNLTYSHVIWDISRAITSHICALQYTDTKRTRTYIDRHIAILEFFGRGTEVMSAVSAVFFAFDLLQNRIVKRIYFEYLYALTLRYPLTLTTSFEGRLIAEYEGYGRAVSQKPVTNRLIYPKEQEKWVMEHLFCDE